MTGVDTVELDRAKSIGSAQLSDWSGIQGPRSSRVVLALNKLVIYTG